MSSLNSLYRDVSLVRTASNTQDHDYHIEPTIISYDISQLAKAELQIRLVVRDRSGKPVFNNDYTGVSGTHGGGLFLAGAMYAPTALTKGCEEAFEFVFKQILLDLPAVTR
jgi:hypothetical protein